MAFTSCNYTVIERKKALDTAVSGFASIFISIFNHVSGTQRSPELALGSIDFHAQRYLIFPALLPQNQNKMSRMKILVENECIQSIFSSIFTNDDNKVPLLKYPIPLGKKEL